ncbi:MAG: hypothetical protein JOY93_03510, partial [Acidobacteriales bacterium]|nr:hypothetical protein [Terriglobales bacterium]
DAFIRPQLFVVSYLYNLPGPSNHFSALGRTLSGWSVSGVTTVQSGQRLTLVYSDPTNVFGVGNGALNLDLAQIAPGCTASQLLSGGSIQHQIATNQSYFNKACFTTPPVIGADGVGTTFGDARPGIVAGPGQLNFDFALAKRTPIGSSENRNLEFRAEFFNLFNHPQFALPNLTNTNFATSTFGVIQSTSVAPRIIQLALKLNF